MQRIARVIYVILIAPLALMVEPPIIASFVKEIYSSLQAQIRLEIKLVKLLAIVDGTVMFKQDYVKNAILLALLVLDQAIINALLVYQIYF